MPVPTARKITCPVLILHGDRDAHVPVKHADYLARTMRLSGNADVTVKIFTDHNHLFLKDPDGRISGYCDLPRHTHQLPPEVLNSITTWLGKHM
jgi:dipeptidyl aminopeptidase/acylaminoacyl peptidase